jgi:polysaccharide biosynthesis transport protein
MQAVVGGMQQGDVAAIRSQLDVISSPELLQRVVTKLGLLGNPDFNPDIDTRKHLRDYLPPGLRNLLFPSPDSAELTQSEQQQRSVEEAVRRIRAHLGVFNDQGRSYTIQLAFTSRDPRLAAKIVNTIAQEYLTAQLEEKFQKTEQVNAWLQEKLEALKQKLEAADTAVQAYRKAHNLLAVAGSTNVVNQQISDMNTQLALAAAEAAQKHGALEQFQAAVRKGVGGAETTPDVFQSPTISQLKVQEAQAARRLASLRSQFGEKHPDVIRAAQELSSTQGRINIEVQKIIGNLADQAQAADYRLQQLRSQMAQLTATAQNNNQAEVQLQQLEREAQADRFLYENMLNRFKETSESQDLQQPDASIIARADIPSKPSFPNKPLFALLAFLGSSCLGLGLALVRERFDNGFRTGSQVEEYTGVPGVGMLPLIGGRVRDELVRNPSSAFSESVRTIKSTISLTDLDHPPRVILVTSAAPQEGKSTTAVSLARAYAQGHKRVLLVDCDWRRPSVHKLLDARDDLSLLDLFRGDIDEASVLQVDPSTGMLFVAARYGVPNPSDLLASGHMRTFIGGATKHFDIVILDSPPVMAASDAAVLSTLADTTLFVVQWEMTPRPMVVNAVKQLRKAGANVAGVILNRVDVKKHRRFGFGDHGYYYGTYNVYSPRAH